jgi:hypothetical protein
VLEKFVLSKLYDFCAVDRPIIIAAGGDAEALVRSFGAALPIEPGNATALSTAVLQLRGERSLGARIASAGHAFGAQHTREEQVNNPASILDAMHAVRKRQFDPPDTDSRRA